MIVLAAIYDEVITNVMLSEGRGAHDKGVILEGSRDNSSAFNHRR